jgi:4-amino-4-deoxy-L-arabinose transferase-like glycosyltransferase
LSAPASVSQQTSKDLNWYELGATIAAYALVLLAGIVTIPLRVPEILQIAGIEKFSFGTFFGWITKAPASAPLGAIAQLPLVLFTGHSRLGVRLLSLAFALGSAYVFWRLARRVLQRPYAALLLFLLIPIHLLFATDGRGFEQALFLLVLASEWFFRIIDKPNYFSAAVYAILLTLAIYTEIYSFLPALGYLACLFRFVNSARERRAIWFVLAATAIPLVCFAPYLIWSQQYWNMDWLGAPPSVTHVSNTVRTIESFAPADWISYILAALLFSGFVVATLASFRNPAWSVTKRVRVFCLAGGIVSTIVITRVLIILAGETFSAGQVLWTIPGFIILFFAALEWVGKLPSRRPLAIGIAWAAVLLSAIADYRYLQHPGMERATEDMRALAAAVPNELTPGSCVVFVSERFSRYLFLEFEPSLAERECVDFFHGRVILASHPYVRPDQEEDAESFFRGLNFHQLKRVRIGGGQIVVMRQGQ